MGISEYRATGGNKAMLNDYHRKLDSTANFQLNFLPSDKQNYAFDYLGSGDHGIFATDEYYPKSGNYDFRYKSIETGKTDYVKVDFSNYNGLKDSVIFKDRYGIKLKLSKDNILTFTGTQKPDTNYIYAYDNLGKRIGKLFVYTYKRQTKNVVLVSVNGAKIDKTITVDGLNKIFKPAVTEFKISEDKIEIPDLKNFTHGGSNWHSVYNSDQKLVLETYDKNIKDDNFYLFFVDNVLDKKDSLGTSVSGYMPRGYNCGFIYEGGSLHTVAHELGHGVGNLEHAFSASNSSGKTQNLMDYSTGEELYHFQWNEIQDPSRVWMKWSKDESEGEIKIGRTDFDTKFYIICISNRDTLFYEAGENIYLLKNSKYKFEIIKRHNFLFGNVMCSTDFKFNNVSWNNNEKKSIYEINTSTYNSEVLKAQIFGDEKIIGYLSNDNKFIRVNDKSLIPNNSKYIEVDANKLGIIEKSDITIISNIILIDRPIVEFVRNKNYQGEYGFDNDFWTENEKTIHYNKIKINGIDYNIPWLSSKTGQEIRINAIINAKNKNIPASTIMFEGEDAEISVVNSLKNINNVINIKPGIVNNFELKVKFLSNNSFDTPKKIYAKLDSETIGCLYYFSTDNFKEANLIIHPFFVNNNYYTEININKIQSYLNNNSFNQSFVYWNVTLCPNDFKNSKIESLISLYKPNLDYPSVNNKNKIAEDLINGVTNQYNSGVILDFIKDYFCFEQMNLNNNDYVLFVTDIEPNNGSEDGIAEQHNPWSVIFKNGINNYSTYVHEITHCIGFNHTFEEKDSKSFGGRGKKVSKNSTENFMDYSDSKIMFWKSDWVDINLNINRK